MRQIEIFHAMVCGVAIALVGCGSSGVRDSSSSADQVASTASSTNSSGTGSIIALSSSAYTVSTSAATAVITVYRNGSATGAAEAGYSTADGTALAGSDYQGATGSLSWADGDQTPKSISVPVAATAGGKSFAVALTSVSGAAVFGSPTQATVDISVGGGGNSTAANASGTSSSASASGSMLPPLTQLVDADGNIWTVSGGVISLNGSVQPITHKVIVLVYYQGVIYQENSDCLWWSWTADAWAATSQPAIAGLPVCTAPSAGSGGTGSSGAGSGSSSSSSSSSGSSSGGGASTPVASPSGSMIPSLTQLVDSAGNTWTVSGGVISLNGVVQAVTHKVIVMLYYQGVIYQENSDCLWWSWSGTASGGSWSSTARPAAAGIPSCSSSVSSAGSSSGGTGGSQASAGNVPAAAAAVGYNTLTYGPAVTLASNWFPWNFYGATNPGPSVQNADGSVYLSGVGNLNSAANIATAYHTHTGNRWSGTAFGGGGYFEAVLSFTGQGPGPYLGGGPTWWALDIEHTSGGPYKVSWPGMPNDANGHPYDDYFEVDFMEYDVHEYSYQNGIGNWYGYPPAKSSSNPYQAVGNSAGSVMVPAGTNFAQFHAYGCLWVPATPGTQGYLKFYFDGVQTGETFYWNWNDPNNPFPPPPVNNSTAMSGMDTRHLMLMIGTGSTQPMTVQSVSVWQASAANNLTE